MSKKVLLLGGAGFIGFNISKYLAENRDYSITIADNFARGKEDELFSALVKKNNIKVIAGDFTDSNAYHKLDNEYEYSVPTPEHVPLCIEDIGHPRFTYAVTKMLGESGFLNYSRILGFEATIVRYHNVYGPRMGFKHVIPHLVVRYRKKENPFKVYGHDQTRAFCYITDAVKGTVLAMEQPGTNGEIYHIGTQEE